MADLNETFIPSEWHHQHWKLHNSRLMMLANHNFLKRKLFLCSLLTLYLLQQGHHSHSLLSIEVQIHNQPLLLLLQGLDLLF